MTDTDYSAALAMALRQLADRVDNGEVRVTDFEHKRPAVDGPVVRGTLKTFLPGPTEYWRIELEHPQGLRDAAAGVLQIEYTAEEVERYTDAEGVFRPPVAPEED